MLLYVMYYINIYVFTSILWWVVADKFTLTFKFSNSIAHKAYGRLSSTFSSGIGQWHVIISMEIWRLFHFIASFDRPNLLIVRPSGRPSLLAFTSHVTIVTFCLICSFCIVYIIKDQPLLLRILLVLIDLQDYTELNVFVHILLQSTTLW